MSQKIDFVIPWVDGSDTVWQEERAKYANYEGDKREIRFRDWDNLHYWFRGVEKYTPWVNKIHFITWGHLPDWLNTDHPKLNIVNHKDYIPSEYLPTFNSHTIELNLHRINDLSDTFVYFNDDMFVLKSMPAEAFFLNGLPRDSAVIMPVFSSFRNSTAAIEANNMEIINTSFVKNEVIKKNITKWFNIKYRKHLLSTLCCLPYKLFAGFYVPHLPNSYLKDTYEELWSKESEVLNGTCKQKFKEGRGVSQSVLRYWQLVTGRFIPRETKIGSCFGLSDHNEHLIRAIAEQRFPLICINDNDAFLISNFEKEKALIKDGFNSILPERSSFELKRQ